jgi:hypothetical protein
MNRKLTLSLDQKIIDFAHGYSRKNRQSISKIVEAYFIHLKEENSLTVSDNISDLYGITADDKLPDKKEIHKAFNEKSTDRS